MLEKLLYPEVEVTRSLYKKIFKNNQINLGVPFEIREYSNENSTAVKKKTQTPAEAAVDPESIIEQAKKEADIIQEEIKAECLKMLEKAESDAKKKSAEIKMKARRSGYREGMQKAEKEMRSKLEEAENTRKKAKKIHDETIIGMENEIIEFSMYIARKIMGEELRTNRESIVNIFRQALEKCDKCENVIVKTSPDDFELIKKSKNELVSQIDQLNDFQIVRDSGMKTGSCVVETPFGTVNAGIEKKLEKIENEFKKVIG